MTAKSEPQWNVPSDRYYDKHHQWYQMEDELVTVGITDYTQDTAGDIVYVSVPAVGATVKSGQPIGSLESGKWVGQIYAPCDGVVVEANEAIEQTPTLLNEAPYTNGWVVKIRPSQAVSSEQFMSAKQYRDQLRVDESA